jgi:hypothetical protein
MHVTEQELEQALRRALRPVDPGEDFSHGVLGRLAVDPVLRVTRRPRRRAPGRWGLAGLLAACVIAGVGVAHWRQAGSQRQRGLQARAQLLEALNIASANVNAVP